MPGRTAATLVLVLAVAILGGHPPTARSTDAHVPSGHLLFFRETRDPLRREIILAGPRGGARRTLIAQHPGGDFRLSKLGDVAVSPDGSELAIVGEEVAGPPGIFLVDLSGSRPEFVPGTSGGVAPVFTADGRDLAFSVLKPSEDSATVEEVDLADDVVRPLVGPRRRVAYVPTSSAPGGRLLLSRVAIGGRVQVKIEERAASGRRRLLFSDAVGGRFSPDGRRIVYSRVPAGTPERLWLARGDGSHPRPLPARGAAQGWAGPDRVLFLDAQSADEAELYRGADDSIRTLDLGSRCGRTLVAASPGTSLRSARWVGPPPSSPTASCQDGDRGRRAG